VLVVKSLQRFSFDAAAKERLARLPYSLLEGLQVEQDLLDRKDVCILLVEIEEIDGVACLVTVECALLGHDHSEPIASTINYGRSQTAAGALAANDDRVDVERDEMSE
jgi:hypothetical protein